jgi:hypothetical protein
MTDKNKGSAAVHVAMYRQLLAERDDLHGQLAALRDAARTVLFAVVGDATFGPSPALGVACRALDAAIADTAAAAEAHDERLRAEGRDEAMADFTAARLFEAERDTLAGQLAALRVAARETLIAYGGEGDPLGAALEAALDDGAQAAEAHEARIIAACAGCIADDDQQIAPAEYTPVVNAMVKRDRRVRAEALAEARDAIGAAFEADEDVSARDVIDRLIERAR